MLDWNDYKYFLAVVRSGTTLGASRLLQVSQSTVSRRIAALEEALGFDLFDKRPAGYVLTEAGGELRAAAEDVEAAATAFASQAGAWTRNLSGSVRLTTNETFANLFLTQAMREFRANYPALRLDVVATDDFLDLRKGEADVALRAGRRPTEPDLVGRCIAKDVWSIYCSRDYMALHGVPQSSVDLARHAVITVDPKDYPGPITDWVVANVPDSAIVLRPNSISGVYAGLKGGIGVTMMSDFVALGDPDLVRCFTPGIEQGEIWLLTHERLRHLPRIRAVMDFLGGYFASGLHKARTSTV